MGNSAELTHEELLAIAKTVTAYNGNNVKFNVDFLKFVNTLKLKVTRTDETITLEVDSIG